MNHASPRPANIDQYIAAFPADVQADLQEIRNTIRQAAPLSEERISYGMPAFAQNGILVYFAGWKEHIGFYPTASGIERFKEELAGYEISKGTVKFPLQEPLPLSLISRIVAFRVKENLDKSKRGK